jgi:uncharacterized delta-60 repeat protein
MAQQPDGKILVAGHAFISNHDRVFVARFNTNGTPDTTFNAGSAFVLAANSSCASTATTDCQALDLALATSGSAVTAIYVTGTSYTSGDLGARVWKFVPGSGQDNWALAAGYGQVPAHDGAAWIAQNRVAFANDIVMSPNGEAVIGGEVLGSGLEDQCAIARLTSGGQLDPSFGTGGTGAVKLEHTKGCTIWGLRRQSGGSYVFAGSTSQYAPSPVALLGRVTSIGEPDSSFVSGGLTAPTSGGSSPSFFFDLTLQGDKVLAVGAVGGPPHDIQLARYYGAP